MELEQNRKGAMATFTLGESEIVERLAEQVGSLMIVLDQIVPRPGSHQTLPAGRTDEVLSHAERVTGTHDRWRPSQTLDGIAEQSGVKLVALLQHATDPSVTDLSWDGHPAVAEVSAAISKLTSLIIADPDLADPDWEIREQVEYVKDLLQTFQREVARSVIDDPRAAADFVLHEMEGVDQTELAKLLGYGSERSLSEHVAADRTPNVRTDNDRIVLIAHIVFDLRNAMSPQGMLAWFYRPRAQLGGKSPVDVINEDLRVADRPIRSLARASMG